MICGLDCECKLKEINLYLKKHSHSSITQIDEYGSADKCVETDILLGAFNYMNEDGFIEFLRTLPWERDTDLFVQKQNDDVFERFKIYRNSDY